MAKGLEPVPNYVCASSHTFSSGWRGAVSVTVEHTPPTPTLSSPLTDMDGSYTVSWTTSSGVVNHKLQESTLSGSTWGSWTTYNVAGTSKTDPETSDAEALAGPGC